MAVFGDISGTKGKLSGRTHGASQTLTGAELYGDAYTFVGRAVGGDDTLTGLSGSSGVVPTNTIYGDAHSIFGQAWGGTIRFRAGAAP